MPLSSSKGGRGTGCPYLLPRGTGCPYLLPRGGGGQDVPPPIFVLAYTPLYVSFEPVASPLPLY